MTPQDVCAKAAEIIRRGGWERMRWTDAYGIFGTVGDRGSNEEIAFKAWLAVEAKLWPKLTTGELASGYRAVDEVLAVLDDEAAKP